MNSEDYKRGVLEASKELIEGTLPSSRLFKVAFDEEMRLRRKKLLTKKVTKWIGVYGSPERLYPSDYFYTSKEEADSAFKTNQESQEIEINPQYLGAYPVEIDVPL